MPPESRRLGRVISPRPARAGVGGARQSPGRREAPPEQLGVEAHPRPLVEGATLGAALDLAGQQGLFVGLLTRASTACRASRAVDAHRLELTLDAKVASTLDPIAVRGVGGGHTPVVHGPSLPEPGDGRVDLRGVERLGEAGSQLGFGQLAPREHADGGGVGVGGSAGDRSVREDVASGGG